MMPNCPPGEFSNTTGLTLLSACAEGGASTVTAVTYTWPARVMVDLKRSVQSGFEVLVDLVAHNDPCEIQATLLAS